MAEKKIDLKAFPATEEGIAEYARIIGDYKLKLEKYKADLLLYWVGNGRNEFEKTYNVMVRKIQDQIDYTWTVYEELLKSHERFIQADVDAAKAMDGIGLEGK